MRRSFIHFLSGRSTEHGAGALLTFNFQLLTRCLLAVVLLFALLVNQVFAASSLADLIQDGKRAEALEMIRVGADVNARQGDGSSPLLWAVFAVDEELVQALLSREADPGAMNDFGASPLGEAVKAANVDLVRMLLEAGADPEAANADGQTALMLATRTGVVEVAKLLLEHGADVNVAEQWRGQTPLMWAAGNDHPAMTKLLLDHGAKVNVRADANDWGSQITNEPRAQYRPTGGLTALLYAARTGCTRCVEDLLAAGADIDKPTPDAVTPLMIAIDNRHYDTAKVLLEQGANPHLWDWWGRTALYIAIDMHSYQGMSQLQRSSQVSAQDAETTALEIARMLLDAGVNPDPQLDMHRPGRGGNSGRFVDDQLTTGATPLLRAANSHDVDAIKLLLAYGADVELPNVMGVTPFMAAAGFGNRRGQLRGTYEDGREAMVIPALEVLLAAGADINRRVADTYSHTARIARMSTMTDRQGQTPLFAATKQNWMTVVQWLVDHGADVGAVDDQGKNLIDAATANNAGGRADRPVNQDMIDLVTRLVGDA